MKLVLHLSHFNWPVGPERLAQMLADVAVTAEDGGFDGMATADHLWQHPMMGGPEANCLEAYTTLGFLAAHTHSMRLLTVVTGAHFRHPAVLAKTVATLDVPLSRSKADDDQRPEGSPNVNDTTTFLSARQEPRPSRAHRPRHHPTDARRHACRRTRRPLNCQTLS